MKTHALIHGVASALLALAASHAGAAVTSTGCAGGSFGDACGLDELLAGGTLVVDGYRFSNFTLSLNGGTLLGASQIRVDAIDSAIGPGFSFVDLTNAMRQVNGGLSSNNLGFDVTAVATGAAIRGASLGADVGDITMNGSYTNVFADLFNPGFTSYLGNMTNYCDGPTCSNSTQSQSLSFAGLSAISVVAGLDVGAATGGMAQLNGLSMTIAAVPEPATWASLAAGLLVVGSLRRRGASR
jgi:hypothetical protein